jgi:monomeric isocitrate dehydrogenase
MKIRVGFVSNSSSSSFAIHLSDISAEQLQLILNVKEEQKKTYELDEYGEYDIDSWNVKVESGYVKGSTFMDNFSMSDYFDEIGVDKSKVVWDD